MSGFGNLVNSLRFIKRQPLGGWPGVIRFARWQFAARLLPSSSVIVPWVDDTVLILERGMHGATGNYYCGLMEHSDMSFLLDFLRPGDLFVDVGANIGSFTVLSAGVCGSQVIALEPGEAAYEALIRNIRANALEDIVETRKIGAGDREGCMNFLSGQGATNRVMPFGEVPLAQQSFSSIPVMTLDKVLNGREPVLIKIDVEGFEPAVLLGAKQALSNSSLKALIVEANDAVLYGFDFHQIFDIANDFGFLPHTYISDERRVVNGLSENSNNVLFIRDSKWVQDRLIDSPQHHIFGKKI